MTHSDKLVFIDYLKAGCILYIVGFWHLLDYTQAFPGYRNAFTEALTQIVLGLFVLLSGFLVGQSAMKSANWKAFYKKRLARIYPLFFLAVVLFKVFGVEGRVPLGKALVFLSMFWTPGPQTLWFVSMIMIFYVTTPLLVRLARTPWRFLVAAASIQALFLVMLVSMPAVDLRLLEFFPCFCVGMYCAINGVGSRFLNIRHAVVLLGVGVAASVLLHTEASTLSHLGRISLVLSSAYLIFATSHLARKFFVERQLISSLSYSSYALYLFHRPFYEMLRDNLFPRQVHLQVVYLFAICLPLLTCLAWNLQRLNDFALTKARTWRQRSPVLPVLRG